LLRDNDATEELVPFYRTLPMAACFTGFKNDSRLRSNHWGTSHEFYYASPPMFVTLTIASIHKYGFSTFCRNYIAICRPTFSARVCIQLCVCSHGDILRQRVQDCAICSDRSKI